MDSFLRNLIIVLLILAIALAIPLTMYNIGKGTTIKAETLIAESGSYASLIADLYRNGYTGQITIYPLCHAERCLSWIRGKIVKAENTYVCTDNGDIKFSQECTAYENVLMIAIEDDVFGR